MDGVRVYVINLDRATERLAIISASLAKHGMDFVRVPAVDGRALPADAPKPVDEPLFERLNGRDLLPGEIGCYMSHLNVFEIIKAQAEAFAVILEDDIEIKDGFVSTVAELQARDDWDVVKLASHRIRMFKPFFTLPNGVQVGRCLHGPYGSSAAYLVRKSAVATLAANLTPMSLPYDQALEAAWKTKVRFFVTDRNLTTVDQMPSMIAFRETYRAARFPWWRRLGAFNHRNAEIRARAAYYKAKT